MAETGDTKGAPEEADLEGQGKAEMGRQRLEGRRDSTARSQPWQEHGEPEGEEVKNLSPEEPQLLKGAQRRCKEAAEGSTRLGSSGMSGEEDGRIGHGG